MTDPLQQLPDVFKKHTTPDPSVHKAPVNDGGDKGHSRLNPGQIALYGEAFVESILAQVVDGLSNITIGDVRPLGFLSDWSDLLQKDAQEALNDASTAKTEHDALSLSIVDAFSTVGELLDKSFGTNGMLEDSFKGLAELLGGGDVPIDQAIKDTVLPMLNISADPVELLSRPGFGEDSVKGGGVWRLDDHIYFEDRDDDDDFEFGSDPDDEDDGPTYYPTDPGDDDSTGGPGFQPKAKSSSDDNDGHSVYTEAAGVERVLWSNESLVAEGQRLKARVHVLADDLIGSGEDLVQLAVTYPDPDESDGSYHTHVLDASDGPSDDPDGWKRAPSGSDAVVLDNAPDDDDEGWRIPEGVNRIRILLIVTDDAKEGRVWFDEASAMLGSETLGHGLELLDGGISDAFDKIGEPFQSIPDLFKPDNWDHAWQGLLKLVGVKEDDRNAIVADPNSMWSRFMQDVIIDGLLGDTENGRKIINALNDIADLFNHGVDGLFDKDRWKHAWNGVVFLLGELGIDELHDWDDLQTDVDKLWDGIFGVKAPDIGKILDSFEKIFAPFHSVSTLFDSSEWDKCLEGINDLLGIIGKSVGDSLFGKSGGDFLKDVVDKLTDFDLDLNDLVPGLDDLGDSILDAVDPGNAFHGSGNIFDKVGDALSNGFDQVTNSAKRSNTSRNRNRRKSGLDWLNPFS